MANSNYAINYIYKLLDQYSSTLYRIEENTKKFSETANKAGQHAAKGMGLFKTAVASILSAEGLEKLAGHAYDFIKASVEMSEKAEISFTQIEVAIKNTNNRAGRSFEQLKKDAMKLSGESTVSTMNIIQGVQKPLLSFNMITGQTFDRVSKIAIEASQKMYGTKVTTEQLAQMTNILGRAYENPLMGMRSLKQAGINLSIEQRKTIQELVKTNQVQAARNLLMDIATKYTKNYSEALKNTPEGREADIANRIQDLQLQIGKSFAPVKESLLSLAVEVLPILAKAFQIITPVIMVMVKVFTFIVDMISRHKIVFGILAGLILVLAVAMNAAAIAQWILNIAMMANPIVLIIVGIAALVIGILWLADNWKKVGAFFVGLWNGIVNAFKNMWAGLMKLLDNPVVRILGLIFLPFITIPLLIIKNWKNIAAFIGNILSGIANNPLFKAVLSIFGGGKPSVNVTTPPPKVPDAPGIPKNSVNVNANSTVSVYTDKDMKVVPYRKGNNLGYNAQTSW